LIGKKTIQCLEGVKKSFLNRVLRVFVREHDRAAHSVRPTLMLSYQRGKRFRFSVLRGDYKRPFFRSGVNGRRHAVRFDCNRSSHRDLAGVQSQ
jgi:hypothetical protein